MPVTPAGVRALRLIGGPLCLDFVNTVEDYRIHAPHEYLGNYADLLAWGRHTSILSLRLVQQLTLAAAKQPEEAARVYRRALELRSALYRLFTARLDDRKPRAEDLVSLNELLGQALSQGRLRSAEERYAWYWTNDEGNPAQILYPIARSTADLLASEDLARVRACDACGWLFLDMSRNHSRHWCSMDDCGNRAKARRHYQLTRKR